MPPKKAVIVPRKRYTYSKADGAMVNPGPVYSNYSMNKAIARSLSRFVEAKYFDIKTTVSTVNNSTPYMQSLTNITQGSGDSQRVGDSIKLQSLQLNLNFYANVLAAVATTYRLIIFKWNPNDGSTAPVIGQILNTGGVSDGYEPLYLPNRDFRAQYHILYDKTFNPIGNTNTLGQATSKSAFIRKIRIKLRNKIQFSAGGTTGTGKIYMLITADGGATEGVWNFVNRIMYKDS